jgi:iron complex outermembrane receptor protein
VQHFNKPVAAICLAVASAFVQAQQATYDFDIPAQPAGQVLDALAKQTGLQPFYAEGAVKGARSPGVKGKLSLREALDKALAGTGLSYQFTGEKAVAIKAREKVAELPEMTVSGRGVASPVPKGIPAVTESVTAQEMAESINAITTDDALKYLPSILVRKRFIGDTNSSLATRTANSQQSARSLAYADNLLLSNLLGNSHHAPRWGLVTSEEIERADVIYGPFSALYPGNSMGATILMTTRMPEKLEGHAKAQAFTERFKLYGTDENFSGHHLAAGVGSRNGNWSWVLNADRLDSHDHPMGHFTTGVSAINAGPGDTVVTGIYQDRDQKDVNRVVLGATAYHTVMDHAKLKVAYDFSPTVRATYTLGLWQNDITGTATTYMRDAAGNPVWTGNALNINGKRYNIRNFGYWYGPSQWAQEHVMHGLSLKTSTGGEWDWEAVASLYDYGRDTIRTPTGNYTSGPRSLGSAGLYEDFKGTGWSSLDLRGIWRPQVFTGHEVSFGYHFDHYKLRYLSSNTADWLVSAPGTRVGANTGDTETTAFYLQESWAFAPAWKAIVGGRWENWKAYNGTISDATTTGKLGKRDDLYFSPKLALTWQATPLWSLRASSGKAYRMPTVYELYQGTNTLGAIIKNDPNLKPEKVLSGELTAERTLGNGLLRISYFRENVEDALYSQRNDATGVTNIQNIDKIRTDGLEVAYQAVDVGIRGLDLSGSVTYTDSEITKNDKYQASVGKKQPRIPDWRASVHVTYRQNAQLAYSLGARYSGRQYNLLDNSDTNPDTYLGASHYFIVDARVQYKIAKQLNAAVGVNNLNNYKAFLGPAYPQRSLVAELKADF